MSILVRMPSTYHCEQGFSSLVEIKSKKRNSIKDVDTVTRGALEARLMPRFLQLADKIQQQQSHLMYCMCFYFYADIVHDFSVIMQSFISLNYYSVGLECMT